MKTSEIISRGELQMVIKVSIPNRLQFKVIPGIKNVLFAKKGDIHYIGGTEVLPPPLDAKSEQ